MTVPVGNANVPVVLALPTEDDTTDEPDGMVTVTLQAADAAYTISSGAGQAVVNVADDDVPVVTVAFSADEYTAMEGGADATVTVSLSGIPDREVNVPVTLMNAGAAADSDWSVEGLQGTPGAYTLAFAEDETSQTFTVTAFDDNFAESASETLALSFGTLPERVSEGAPVVATLILEDDESAPTIRLSAPLTTLVEGTGAADVVVMATLEGGSTLQDDLMIDLILDGAAIRDTDYTVAGPESISITAGGTTGMTTLTITPTPDSIAEGDETIVITAMAGTLVVGDSVTLTLQDRAPYTVSVSAVHSRQ